MLKEHMMMRESEALKVGRVGVAATSPQVSVGCIGDHGGRHGDLWVRAAGVERAVLGLDLQREESVRISEGEC